MNRRRFINITVRSSVFTGLGVMSTVLFFQSKKKNVNNCNYDFVCNNCKKIKDCKLPQAALYKIEREEKKKMND